MIDERVTVREVAVWLGIFNTVTVKNWPWVKPHLVPGRKKNYAYSIPLWVLEDRVGGPLEPMYNSDEVCRYIGISRGRLNGQGIKKVIFSKKCVRYPESAITEYMARKTKLRHIS